MKEEKDYIQDIAEIRSMMERSSKFLSLSGLAGILVGALALAGAYIAYNFLGFNPQDISYTNSSPEAIGQIVVLALGIVLLALIIAVYISYRESIKRKERLWNPTSRRLAFSMAVPFISGGVLILILLSKGLIGLIAPISVLFYGLALYNAGKYTYQEIRVLGFVEICLGLIGVYFISSGLLVWALGFGVAHIIYGIYMHFKYEK